MKLDLVHRRRDARFADDPFEVIGIEIRDADRANPPIPVETNERFPAFDIKVDAWARPMDQIQIERVAAELFDALVECAQRFVEAVIRIAELRRHENVSVAEQSLADAVLVSIHRRRIDQAIAFVHRHFYHPSRLIGRRLKDAKPELRHGWAVIEGDSRLGFTGHRYFPSLAERIAGGRRAFEAATGPGGRFGASRNIPQAST